MRECFRKIHYGSLSRKKYGKSSYVCRIDFRKNVTSIDNSLKVKNCLFYYLKSYLQAFIKECIENAAFKRMRKMEADKTV